jgi:hypothetical protein
LHRSFSIGTSMAIEVPIASVRFSKFLK